MKTAAPAACCMRHQRAFQPLPQSSVGIYMRVVTDEYMALSSPLLSSHSLASKVASRATDRLISPGLRLCSLSCSWMQRHSTSSLPSPCMWNRRRRYSKHVSQICSSTQCLFRCAQLLLPWMIGCNLFGCLTNWPILISDAIGRGRLV